MSDWFLPEGERALGRRELVPPHVRGADYFARHLEVVEPRGLATGSSSR